MNARRYSSDVDTRQGDGRVAQKRRTRRAIVEAARDLLAAGRTPSVDDVAAAADVSRRTIYMHFPTLDQLLLDAASGLLAETTVDARLGESDSDGDVLARTDALARGLVEVAPEALPLGRKIIALTVDAPASDPARRGHRRLEWVERALAPAREQLSPERYERLVSALCVVLGWEAMVVLRDIRGLDAGAEEDTIRWAARALVQTALDEERASL